jgi:hypothetical protein
MLKSPTTCGRAANYMLVALLLLQSVICYAQKIIKAEYFFDVDPGVGNGVSLTIPAPDETVTFSSTINVSALRGGRHYLFVRTRTSDGRWSLSEPREFFVMIPAVKAEYFFDSDPGVGNGTPHTIPAPDDTITFSHGINTSGLRGGRHYLFVRTCASNGKWSLSEPREFFIRVPMEAEYFFDSDPGVGNATPLTLSERREKEAYDASFSIGRLSLGDHYLFIRTRSESGNWSLHEPTLFTVSEVLPVELTDFSAIPRGMNVDLFWITHSEVNNDYFVVERWIGDAYDTKECFVAIDTIPGQGTSSATHRYQFTDKPGITGTIYYRLKQVDYDGSFTYSNVVVVNLEAANVVINLHPNPSSDRFILEPTGDISLLSVAMFDLSGKEIEFYKNVKKPLLFGNDWSPGIYLVKIQLLKEVLVIRVAKAP